MSEEHHLETARILVFKGQAREALLVCESLLRQSTSEEIHWEVVRVLRQMGQIVRAKEALENLLESDPNDLRWLNARAILDLEANRSEEGTTTLAALAPRLALNPLWGARVETNKAVFHFEKGDSGQGLSCASAALEMDPDLKRPRFLTRLFSPNVQKVDPARLFRGGTTLHLYPYLNFDLAWNEAPCPATFLQADGAYDRLRVRFSVEGGSLNPRFLPGAKVITSVALEEGIYGTLSTMTVGQDAEVEMATLRGPTLLTPIERRRYARARLFDPVFQIVTKGPDGWITLPRTAYAVMDLSASGMRLSSRQELTFGQLLRVDFRIDQKPMVAGGFVTRVGSDQTYGVHFLFSDEHAQECLQQAVLRQVRQSGIVP